MTERALPGGNMSYELTDPSSGRPLALLDLAWPTGIQEGLSQPVCLLLNEPAETIATASNAGFRCFTTEDSFKVHVERDVLADAAE